MAVIFDIEHAARVAARVAYLGSDAVLAAFLHDVIEDGYFTRDEVESWEVHSEVLKLLDLLTRGEQEQYEDYIERIATSKSFLAMRIKQADLEHNLSRIHLHPQGRGEFLRPRYESAQKRLRRAEFEWVTVEDLM